jgi:peptidoglycan hydrolase-like protein with peptidoglycan-binding domain
MHAGSGIVTVRPGLAMGVVDGILGERPHAAVRDEQLRRGLPAGGWPIPTMLSNL